MDNKLRIKSILEINSLDFSSFGLQSFNLSKLTISNDLDFILPTNIRLGHLVEKIVSKMITVSSNYEVIKENYQIIEDKKTIGEIDFIIKDLKNNAYTHLELAYKFYLYDPSISKNEIENWIGPNRNDSLIEKLTKLKTKQFPLLHHKRVVSELEYLTTEQISQKLCFLASLYIPFELKSKLNTIYQSAIKGYYLNLKQFISINNNDKQYYLPSKKEWGMPPASNKEWIENKELLTKINKSLVEKQSVLCWQKQNEIYTSFFIVWW